MGERVGLAVAKAHFGKRKTQSGHVTSDTFVNRTDGQEKRTCDVLTDEHINIHICVTLYTYIYTRLHTLITLGARPIRRLGISRDVDRQ